MDVGERRRLQRERRRKEHGTTKVSREEGTSPALIAFALLAFGIQTGGIWREEIITALIRVYCTPESCLTLPQALTGWAIAVAPLPVYLWHRRAAFYLGSFLLGLVGVFITLGGGLWVLPLSYFLVGALFVPISIAVSLLARPEWRTPVVAAQHWLLLAGLILWLA